MKKILKLTTVMAFMFATVVGMAKEPNFSLVSNEHAKGLIFKLDAQSNKTTLKFLDKEEHIIYRENFSNGIFSKKIDLKLIENGIYSFVMENELRSVVYTVDVNSMGVKIIERIEKNKPFFRKKGDLVYVNLLNVNTDDVVIEVYDNNGEILFNEIIENSLIVGKVFNFKKAKNGNYTVIVKDKSTSYYKNIIVD